MTDASDADALAEHLAEAVLAVDGVRELFPARPAAAVLSITTAGRPAPRDVVEVEAQGTALRAVVRLGTSRTVASPLVAERVLAKVRALLGPEAAVEIELALID